MQFFVSILVAATLIVIFVTNCFKTRLYPNFLIADSLLVRIANWFVVLFFVTGLSHLTSFGEVSCNVHRNVEAFAWILGIVVQNVGSQNWVNASANINSHNSTAAVKLSRSCFALAFCYCFGLAEQLSRRWGNSTSRPSCISSCFFFQTPIVTFLASGDLYFCLLQKTGVWER